MPSKITNDRSGRKGFWLRTLADPVLLYTVLVMMSLMFHYRDRSTTAEQLSKFAEDMRELRSSFVYGAVTYVAGWLLFRLYDFMQKHKVIGTVGLIAVSAAVLWGVDWCIWKGYEVYPLDWSVWMLSPQDTMSFNKYYAFSVYLLFFMFMATVIYYFTRVRYRILMNFLIFIIPFAIYGKEYEKMPIGYIILLAVGYMLLMVTFRQLSDSDRYVVVEKPETWKAVAVYTVIFALVSTLIPKPEVEAERSYIESLINADAFTDRLDAMLNIFRDKADGSQYRGKLGNATVYYSDSTEPLDIKTDTFSTYDFLTDNWSRSDLDTFYSSTEKTPITIAHNGSTPDAVFLAAEIDPVFAKRYDLEEYAGMILPSPEEKTVTFFNIRPDVYAAPVPEGVDALESTSFKHQICKMRSGVLVAEEGTSVEPADRFTFTYRPEGFFQNSENLRIVDMLGSKEDYDQMIRDAYDVVYGEYCDYSGNDEEYEKRLYDASCSLNFSSKYIGDVETILLDYGNNEQIKQLAEEITAGDATDYEKAKSLEFYFLNNGYRYDLNYAKPEGENVVDFLFDTKVGVCYEYATAMVLMSRSLGIPARLCEGYSMQEVAEEGSVAAMFVYNTTGIRIADVAAKNNGMTGYVVSGNDAHAFPELYIRGYGWKAFEPTMTAGGTDEKERRTTNGLSRMGLFILAAAVLALLLMIAWPVLSHKLFLFINRRRKPAEQVKACMHRICRLYGAGSESTSHEAAALAAAFSGADVSVTASLFDKAVYGGAEMNDNDAEMAVKEYVKAYEALRDKKKAARKERRRKQAV